MAVYQMGHVRMAMSPVVDASMCSMLLVHGPGSGVLWSPPALVGLVSLHTVNTCSVCIYEYSNTFMVYFSVFGTAYNVLLSSRTMERLLLRCYRSCGCYDFPSSGATFQLEYYHPSHVVVLRAATHQPSRGVPSNLRKRYLTLHEY